jgi:hypothetical protein
MLPVSCKFPRTCLKMVDQSDFLTVLVEEIQPSQTMELSKLGA